MIKWVEDSHDLVLQHWLRVELLAFFTIGVKVSIELVIPKKRRLWLEQLDVRISTPYADPKD